jgi:hypothetical protein
MATSAEIPNQRSGNNSSQQAVSGFPDLLQSASSLARDFLIDVLSSLIGIIFIIAVCALVITSGTCFLNAFGQGAPRTEPTFGILLTTQVDALHAWILFIVAYVLGGIFHRLDPKRPDRKSLERALRGMTDEDFKCSPVQWSGAVPNSWRWKINVPLCWFLDRFSLLPKDALGRMNAAKIASLPGAHFPYSHMGKYLQSRELDHLVALIPWANRSDWETDSNRRGCSKMFINMLKIRMQWVAPRKCSEIVRNEAHVRMMSSVWYAAKAVFSLTIVSLLPVLAVIWRLHSNGKSIYDALTTHDIVVYGAVASFAYISALWLKWHVESRFHYQRVKEVVYVLETAYCMKNSMDHKKILGSPAEVSDSQAQNSHSQQ